jgi:DNA processing protein
VHALLTRELSALLGLLLGRGVGRRTIRRVVAETWKRGGTTLEAAACLRTDFGVRVARNTEVALELAAIERLGLSVVRIGDAHYPEALASIPDAPVALFVRGDTSALVRPLNVAIVGSRRGSPSGRQFARVLAADLGRAGISIVSGLAIGVDGAAHRGALEVSATTVAIVGSGHCRVYPGSHRSLAAEIVAAGGALATEYPPSSTPLPGNFPERNRIISGVAAGIVVVEASVKSGSLITARMALEQGREVMAVPGSVLDGTHGGCHRLIKQGAALVESAQDVLYAFGLEPILVARRDRPEDPTLDRVLGALSLTPATLQRIVASLAMSAQEVLSALVVLELDGFVESVRGGYIRRPYSSGDS